MAPSRALAFSRLTARLAATAPTHSSTSTSPRAMLERRLAVGPGRQDVRRRRPGVRVWGMTCFSPRWLVSPFFVHFSARLKERRYFQRKCTKTRPKLSESFSTR